MGEECLVRGGLAKTPQRSRTSYSSIPRSASQPARPITRSKAKNAPGSAVRGYAATSLHAWTPYIREAVQPPTAYWVGLRKLGGFSLFQHLWHAPPTANLFCTTFPLLVVLGTRLRLF